GTVPLTPSHDIGWLALVDSRGKIVATSDHASPVAGITRVSGFIAVQGDERNLSIYDMNLRSLWDHDSPVTDALLMPGDFVGGEAEDLVVVGTRSYGVSTANADSIRKYLDMPEFMAGAARTNGGYELRRLFSTLYVSNEERLLEILADDSEAAFDAFLSGELDRAVDHATTARAAAAVLGRRQEVVELTSRIHEYVSYPVRRRALLLAAFVLAALGVWVTVDCMKDLMSSQTSIVLSFTLFATAAGVSCVLGSTGLNPLLLVGGAAAMVCVVRAQLRPDVVRRRVPGAAIEDLIRALMEFLHGAGEGVPSDGVVDAARKSVTKVAYLAQEMSDSMDDTERYAMLRERFRTRGEDFLDTTYPRVALLLSLAKRTGFVTSEAEQMSRAAERMRGAVSTVLRDAAPERPIIKQQLTALREARDSLASAADRAWAVVQTNPGCSLRQSVDRILREKHEELVGADVRVTCTRGVPSEQDAVALWSFQFQFILENLVTNAIRAMSDTREKTITVETSTDGTTCTVRFSDTGCGMTEQTAAGIFRSRSEERGGGSGLPSSRALLQERGGNIVVERTAGGEGTTFTLTVPHWTAHRGEQ
ncbi:MAG: ATP-binding protein, partial [Candidatus Eisenbacteria bacterium]|nr:ATP-binding protein [Candidatus Eisenbacteria bacterium]